MESGYDRDQTHRDAGDDSVEVGNNAPRGTTLVLNDEWLATADEMQVRGYVDAVVDAALVSTSGTHADAQSRYDAVRTHLVERFAASGVALAEPELDALTDRLCRDEEYELNIVTSDGRVLYGDADATAARHEPVVVGNEDPDEPDRPTYS